MYLCYCDESGYCGGRDDPDQPVMVMVGILPNVYNYHRSAAEFGEVFEIINSRIPLDELKGEQIYRGRGSWAAIDPQARDRVLEFYLGWVNNGPHKLIISAVDNGEYFHQLPNVPAPSIRMTIHCPYLFCGLHIAMVVQKLNRTKKKNKGKTLLIYDQQDQFSDELANLIFEPPPFIDLFVKSERHKEGNRLGQIVDSAFFVKSHHSSMAQVVDIVAYLVRLHLELEFYGSEEAYQGEREKIRSWIDRIRDGWVPLAKIYPMKRAPFTDFINSIKASGIRD